MYLPLAEPLGEAGANVIFIVIDGFHYVHHHPDDKSLGNVNIRKITLSHKGSQGGKLLFFKLIYKELLPQWHNLLNDYDKGIVVGPDYASLHRMLMRVSSKKGFTNVALQDGSYIGNIKKFGSSLEGWHQQIIKKLMLYTPLEKFINREFGAAADYWGVFGNTIKERLINGSGFREDRISVIGSPRFNAFRNRVNKRIERKMEYLRCFVCQRTSRVLKISY